MKLPVLYLHGFASDPTSSKARFIGERLRSEGRVFSIPDLNCGDFTRMTAERSLAEAREGAASLGGPYAVIGSSFGGYIAALLASAGDPLLRGLFLMAPAFRPAELWKLGMLPEDFARWEAEGTTMVDHFAWGRRVPLSFDFCRDLASKPEFPDIGRLPCVIVHGTEDVVVPIDLSKRFASMHTQVVVHTVADSHELGGSVPWIAGRVLEFLKSLE